MLQQRTVHNGAEMVGVQGRWPGPYAQEVDGALPHHSPALARKRSALHGDHPICRAMKIGSAGASAQALCGCVAHCMLTMCDVVQCLQLAGIPTEVTRAACCAAALWREGEAACVHTH
jgi:hypothetical protein